MLSLSAVFVRDFFILKKNKVCIFFLCLLCAVLLPLPSLSETVHIAFNCMTAEFEGIQWICVWALVILFMDLCCFCILWQLNIFINKLNALGYWAEHLEGFFNLVLFIGVCINLNVCKSYWVFLKVLHCFFQSQVNAMAIKTKTNLLNLLT